MPSHTRSGFQLRRATRADLPALIELIAALAQFEKLPPPNAEEQERLMEDGFGERPRFEAWLAFGEGETKPVGYAVFFETYSTFRATPTLYLEDIFVLPKYRRRGMGSAFLRHNRHRRISRQPRPRVIFDQRHQHQDRQPGQAGDDEDFGQPAASFDVHEIEHDQHRFGDRDRHGDDDADAAAPGDVGGADGNDQQRH